VRPPSCKVFPRARRCRLCPKRWFLGRGWGTRCPRRLGGKYEIMKKYGELTGAKDLGEVLGKPCGPEGGPVGN